MVTGGLGEAIPAVAVGGRLTLVDWGVLAGYSVVLVVTGWMFNRRAARDTGEFFLGGRRMPVWAVSISVVATALSAATFVGGPQQAYAGNLTYLASNIGMVIAAVLIAWKLIPLLYARGAATPYGLLEQRTGVTGRRAAAAAFLGGRVMASGARVFIIGIPASLILFGEPAVTASNPVGLIPSWQIVSAIAAVTVVGTAYTLAGGVRSVIWTDVIQMGVFVVAIGGAIWLLLDRIPGGAATAIEVLGSVEQAGGTSKLTLLDTSLNFGAPYTLLACCTAFVLMGIASYGLDQDAMQRMLTCRSAGRGAASVIAANLAGIPVVAMFMTVGLLLFVFYERPDVMGEAAPDYEVYDSSRIFLSFILRELPPGLGGLMMAGLFAAGISSLNSGLNSMSSTVVNDFYRAMRPGKTERHYLWLGRGLVVFWGLALGGFATLCVFWQRAGDQTLIDFALGVMTFAYAGLLGVFFTVVLTPRGSAGSAVAALVIGFAAVLMLNEGALALAIDTRGLAARVEWLDAAWSLAFPWKLTIGAAAATAVCLLGSPRAAPHASEEDPSA